MKASAVAAIGSAGAAICAVGVAVWQVRAAVKANRMQATFSHLRTVAAACQAIRGRDPDQCRSQVLGFYQDSSVTMSEGAHAYLDFMTELDLLGLAYANESVDRAVVVDYMKGLLRNPYAVSLAFTTDLRRVSNDATTFEHLFQLVTIAREAP